MRRPDYTNYFRLTHTITIMATKPEEVIDAYVRCLEGDDINIPLAREIWHTTNDATFIHPRGHERGWPEIERNFFIGTMRDRLSNRKLQVRDISIHEHGDFAWAEFNWEFTATFRHDRTPLHTQGRETQIMRRIGQEWRIVHVHYSGMRVTGEREGF